MIFDFEFSIIFLLLDPGTVARYLQPNLKLAPKMLSLERYPVEVENPEILLLEEEDILALDS